MLLPGGGLTVGFVEKQRRRYNGFDFGPWKCERYSYSCGRKLPGELGLTTESMYYPQLSWRNGLVELENAPVAAHTVYYKGFLHLLGQEGLAHEYIFLNGGISTTDSIETGLANSHHTRIGSHGLKPIECIVGYSRHSTPRMYPHRIPCLSVVAYQRLGWLDGTNHIGPYMPVGMYIAERMQVGNHGTGSYPLPPQGWQRSIRFTASHKPLKGPCLRSASIAYWLQVGVNRQAGGVRGDMQAL